jgi:hypothetical protein
VRLPEVLLQAVGVDHGRVWASHESVSLRYL